MPARIVAVLLLAVLLGCAGSAWRQAREEDSVTAYRTFLKDHSNSEFSDEARARLDLTRLRHKPTREGYDAFLAAHPDPALEAELRPHVERVFFEQARTEGSAAAYRDFLDQFPDGDFAARAEGNAVYLEEDGFRGDVEALLEFAKSHPESDHASEATRSAATVQHRGRSGFRRVGLVVDVDPSTPGADRVWRVFRDRAVAAYTAAGLQMKLLKDASEAPAHGLNAVLRIAHREVENATLVQGGQFTEPGVHATTEVTLQRVGEPGTIWSESLEYRAPLSARRKDVSILFGPGARSGYWAELDGEFFVPVARWSTQAAAREPKHFPKPVVAVEMVGHRAVVLFGDGDFQLHDLSDPNQPEKLGEYRRKRDLSEFDGVTLAGSQVAIFGVDGVEIVRIEGEKMRREALFARGVVGSAVNVERIGGAWLAATNRGLLVLGSDDSEVETLIPQEIFGMARSGDRMVFTDGISVYTARPDGLRQGRVDAQLRLGRGFKPGRVRVHGQTAVVMGERDSVWVDLRGTQPRLLSRIGGNESGRVLDAAVIGGRLFLLGPRGLQVVDRRGERIVDSVDVVARERIDVAGRHLVMVGEEKLQVVDATPFLVSAAAASE